MYKVCIAGTLLLLYIFSLCKISLSKINFINSGAVDIIRTAYYICGLELMKLIFAVLDVLFPMGLTRCNKTEGFLHL